LWICEILLNTTHTLVVCNSERIDFGYSIITKKIKSDVQRCCPDSRIILLFSLFSETERRIRKKIDSYKFKEVVRDKLWLFIRISSHLGVIRHIQHIE
jgi:hypothetical protein